MDHIIWDRPIIILGNPRSGTSLLRLMLDSHKNISIPPESHFFLYLEEKYREWSSGLLSNYLDDLYRSTKFETWNIDREDLKAFLNEKNITSYAFLNALIYRYYATKLNSSTLFWGDKNSLWTEKLSNISLHYPNAFFIHIIRDGRDVACSYRELGKRTINSKYAPDLPQDIKVIAKEWNMNIRAIDEFLDSVNESNKAIVQYEDLLNNPSQILSTILQNLDLELDENQLLYYEKPQKEIEPELYFQWKEKLLQPLDTSNIGKYNTLLTKNEIQLFNTIAATSLKKYDYS